MKYMQKWLGRNCAEAEDAFFEARVPGNIQYDYGVAHGFDDVQYADNVNQYRALEDVAWEYVSKLTYARGEGERVFFVTEGIQYAYEIWINGVSVYSYEGMCRSVEVDLTDHLNGSEDILKIRIAPHPKSTLGAPNTRDEAAESCNPAVQYGWDWNPRLLISGLWEDAYIETRNSYYIGACEVLATLSEDLQVGRVSYDFLCAEPCETILYDADGAVVYRGSDRHIVVEAPHLWWCVGQGDPYLYRWEIRNDGMTQSGYIGFRTLRLLRNEGFTGPKIFPKTRYEAPATVELNGRRILIKGSNWVNPDLFWGHVDEKRYDELLTLARDCHMNMLRIWGGASFNKRSFYEICDRYGILIWQEFMLACNNYRDGAHYMKVLESEASAMIRKLRSHPCIAFWCGGNELFNNWSGMDDQSHPLRLLNKLCYELDYDRPFLPTSPLFGMAHGGYAFYDEQQRGEVFTQFQSAHNTAYTEFGVPAVTDAETLKRIIPEEEWFPPRKTPAWLAHHGFDAWGSERWLCLDVYRKYFGEPNSLEDIASNSSWLQCEGYRGAFEEMRRQWPHCSMMLNWCFNEPWITVGNNTVVSYPARPRPSYYAVQSALRPHLFSAKISKFSWKADETFEAELWLLNDVPAAVSGKVRVTLQIGEQSYHLLDWEADVAAGKNLRGPTVRMVLPNLDAECLTLKLTAENGMENEYRLMYRSRIEKKQVKILNM